MNDLASALGRGQSLTLAGREWLIEPLDMNDLIDLEAAMQGEPPAPSEIEFGVPNPLGRLNVLSLSHQLTLLHLVLRKADPEISDADRENFRYRLTKAQVARMFGPRELTDPQTLLFVGQVIRLSGLLGDADVLDGGPGEDAPSKKPRAGTRKKTSAPAA